MDQLDSNGKLKLTNSYQFLKAQTDAFLDFIKINKQDRCYLAAFTMRLI